VNVLRPRVLGPPGRRARHHRAPADFSLLALSETDLGTLLTAAAQAAARGLDAEFGSVFELQPDGRTLLLRAAFGSQLPGEPVVCDVNSKHPVAEAFRADAPLLFGHHGAGAEPGPLGPYAVGSSAAIVIRAAGRPFGVLAVHARRADAFTADDLLVLRSVANALAGATARERAATEARGMAALVESSLDAILRRTPDGIVTHWNAAAERLYGYTAEEMIGKPIHILFPRGSDEFAELNARLERGELIRDIETVRRHKDGSLIYVSSTISPITDESGRLVAVSAIGRDIGEQRRASEQMERVLLAERDAREAAEVAGERLRFLAEASEILAGSLDFEATLSGVARLSVPRLADWCVVYLLGDRGALTRVALAHGDPAKEPLAAQLRRGGAPTVTGRHGLAKALRTGKSQLTTVSDEDLAEAASGDPNLGAIYREFSITTAMFVPLVTRERVIGAISFLSEDPERIYGEDDLQLAEELARRAALAVDNARLFTGAQRELERRTRVEESLRRSEEQYRLMFEANPNPMWFFDTETLAFLAVNDAAVRKYGYSREEFLAMRSVDIRPEEDVQVHVESVKKATAAGGVAQAGVRRHLRKDGSLMYVEVTSQPLDFEGQPAQVVLMLEVTERVAAEQALRQSEARYRELVENAHELIATVDLESRFTSVNTAFAKALGYSRHELIGKSLRDFVPPDQHAVLDHARTAELEREVESNTYEHDVIARDGRRITLEVASRLTEVDGAPMGVQAICRDISERRDAERSLRAAEERYRTLVEGLPLVTFTRAPTPEAPMTYMSPQVEQLFGYRPEEWLEDPELFRKLIHPDDLERLREADASGARFNRFRMTRRDGREVWVYDERNVVRDESGNPLYEQGFWLDITDRQRFASELRESQELYRLVVENTRDLVGIFDPDGRFLFASPSHAAVLGYSPEELVGRHASEFRHPDDGGSVSTAAADPDAASGGMTMRLRLLHKDGHYVVIEGFVVPIFNPDGSLRMVLATGRDVSDRLRADDLAEQLRQAQKMEAIGRLAGGIAHDFNNLLTVITGYSDLARIRTDVGQIHEAIEQISAAAKTGSALTGQLLAFSRHQVVQPRVLDPSAAIRKAERLLDRLIGEDVLLELQLDPGLMSITADPTQVEQVLLNLATNAREAMPEGGRLAIEGRNVTVDEESMPILVGLEPGSYVVISVSDTGVGMDEATRARIFEPFFTTKEDGTGLGLPTVYGILTQSGGRVLVETEPGVGTTFRLVFPAVEGAIAPAAPDESADEDLDGSQTVLIVEDEEIVRGLVQEILSGHGYTVLAAATPDEALALASSWTGPLHLVLSDVMLPGIRGPRLVEEVLMLHPEAKTIYTSGYAPALISERGVQSEQPFLPKPFTAIALASKVREVLAV
jgi:two-component system cell cycle sensor histidine kinase/response regulator CckA